jgi:hypothetical protein
MAKRRRASKRSVRCTLCTTHRWFGNSKGRFKAKDEQLKKLSKKEIKDVRLHKE